MPLEAVVPVGETDFIEAASSSSAERRIRDEAEPSFVEGAIIAGLVR